MQIDAIPLTIWQNELFQAAQIHVYLARLDLIHPDFGGNKYFKLKYNVAEMRRQGKDTLVTFGGAYSNHIWATAALGHHQGFKTIGYIRGEETLPLNSVLGQARQWGMELRYVNRTDYRSLKTGEMTCLPNEYVVPEGGSNHLAVKGCAEILSHIDLPTYQYVATACGTGATLAGLVSSGVEAQFLGVSVLKGGDFLKTEVEKLAYTPAQNFQIFTTYHFGGYAKSNFVLKDFCENFAKKYFTLDEIYVGKMLYAIEDLAQKAFFPPQSNILALITQRQHI